jgi:hypothetical protein
MVRQAGSLVRFQRGALMFLATALLYPCVLAALCLGTGLLVDRCSARSLPAPLLLPVGAAGLIALSQLSTYLYVLAPATPYLMVVAAISGVALGRRRGLRLLRGMGRRPSLGVVSLLAYLIALAPVLASGRTTFSSYMVLADSAVHLIGADFLIRHGQHYVHLDLRNSYGQFINDYYNTSYPSGSDTLFGGSAFLLGLPLIWAFQPFNAFMLATGVGPAWMIARRLGLTGVWALLAALTAVLPALVYAYELFGSIKEITCLPIILALGALLATHRSWLDRGVARTIPFVLLLAAGVSSLGVGFGVWALASCAMAGVILAHGLLRAGHPRARTYARGSARLVIGAGAVLVIAAWPTWINLRGALNVAQDIATTTNPGNLQSPLHAIQVFGIWLGGSYKVAPHGSALQATHILIALTALMAALGAVHLLLRRSFALAGWIALMLLAWLVVSASATTWAAAKTLMLTSPLVMLLAWGGVGALRALPSRVISLSLTTLVALALVGGVIYSDALQYHVANLAPTARFQELASLDSRFAGQGPTLFTDFDEYSMYELRNLNIGGPNFVYPPPTLASAAGGYGDPVQLNRIRPDLLAAYPLIITRREPFEVRPPAAYSLVWQGSYYQVWRRQENEHWTVFHRALSGAAPSQQCRQIGRLAAVATSYFTRGAGGGQMRLTASVAPSVVSIRLDRAAHPKDWGHERHGLVMSHPGRLSATFTLPRGGVWNVWVQGQLMPTVELSVDRRNIASIGGQLSGNSLVPNTVPPIPIHLTAGVHHLWVTRGAGTLAPGDGGAAVLNAVSLTPASTPAAGVLRSSPISGWRQLCGANYQWVELTGA